MATASLIVGIASMFLSLLFVPAIVGLILGIVGLNKAGQTNPPVGKGPAITGIVLSSLALLLGIGLVNVISSVDDLDEEGTATVQEDARGSDTKDEGDGKGTSAEEGDDAKAEEGGDAKAEEEPTKQEKSAGVGDPVRDGKFEFTVTDVETGVAEVGDEFFGETAQGQFVVVHMSVENVGNEAQWFDGSMVTGYDAEGREFSSDSSAAIYLEESNSFLNEINPGNKVDGIVLFDVPKDVKLTRLTLHDSFFSGGVDVSLR